MSKRKKKDYRKERLTEENWDYYSPPNSTPRSQLSLFDKNEHELAQKVVMILVEQIEEKK